jgi:hypothetical protein
MEKKIESLEKEVRELREHIQLLTNEIKNLTSSCSRMDDHITFVNGVYTSVRHPVSYMFNKVRRIMGKSEDVDLPQIKE